MATSYVHPQRANLPVRGQARWTSRLRDRWLLSLALTGMMVQGASLSLGLFKLDLGRLVGLFLLGSLAYKLLSQTSFSSARTLLWLWVSWCGALLASTLLTASPIAHISPLIIALIPTAYFAHLTGQRVDGAFLDRVVRVLLWVHGILGAVVLVMLRIVGPTRIPLHLVEGIGRLKLFTMEPNLLGSALGFLVLLSLPRARLTWSNAVMYLLVAITLLAALSKAPLIALAMCLAIYGVLRSVANRTSASVALVLPIWIGILGAAVLLALLPSAQDFYASALQRNDAIFSRNYFLQIALNQYWQSPIIGRGAGDFGLQDISLLRRVGATEANNLWISQMFVNILHDSGLIGLILYIGLILGVLKKGIEWIKIGSVDHCGYLAGFLSILISSQASTVHLNPIFGIAAGLTVCVPVVLRRRKRSAPSSLSNGLAKGLQTLA